MGTTVHQVPAASQRHVTTALTSSPVRPWPDQELFSCELDDNRALVVEITAKSSEPSLGRRFIDSGSDIAGDVRQEGRVELGER